MSVERMLERRLRVAAALARGECEGGYLDACIILSATISSVAAYLWPGERIDRARFVETWIQFGGNRPDALWCSVPLLIQSLYADGHDANAERLVASRPTMLDDGSRVIIGDEVDGDEVDLQARCPALSLRTIREHSYAALFYEHVRSYAVHEYRLSEDATKWPMTSRPNPGVSYSNTLRVLHLNEGVQRDASTREIHYHVEWVIDLARTIGRNVDRAAPSGDLARPPQSWIRPGPDALTATP